MEGVVSVAEIILCVIVVFGAFMLGVMVGWHERVSSKGSDTK